MASIDHVLDEVARLLRSVKPEEAEAMLSSLIQELGPDELRVWEPDLRVKIDEFLPKRRRRLLEHLTNSLASHTRTHHANDNRVPQSAKAISREMRSALDAFRDDLSDLSTHHIFQWSTWYRDKFTEFSNRFIAATKRGQSTSPVPGLLVRELVEAHAFEIFTKGYEYRSQRADRDLAITKARSGLQRFIDVPLEYYSTALIREPLAPEAVVLRKLVSGLLAGVLLGFARCDFAQDAGVDLMAGDPSVWAHALAFLSSDDMEAVTDRIAPAAPYLTFQSAQIFAAGVDRFASASRSYVPMPSLSSYRQRGETLDVTLGASAEGTANDPISVIVALAARSVTVNLLLDGSFRKTNAIVGELTDEARGHIALNPDLDGLVIDPTTESDPSQTLADKFDLTVYRTPGVTRASQPIRHNFARDFPIGNPFLARYYKVDRPSVRNILRTVERRNGIRLWCSVRRSGKTTAGLDLGSSSTDVEVITQTCDDTGQTPQEQVLYHRVVQALETGRHIASNFLRDTLSDCGAPGSEALGGERRKVLILDEYETLFGTLASQSLADSRLRYAVAQPLLNQFVTFSRDNLVVFLGQQPTAHNILMDQNQLSPYVIQDQFPLFSHASHGDEFSELLRRILTTRVNFDSGFSDRVFKETSGHPYITANVMVEFVDWLIELQRRIDGLSLSCGDFDEFANARLSKGHIRLSPAYSFFRDAVIQEALSTLGRTHTPWLHATYAVMRQICLDSSSDLSVGYSDYVEICLRLGLPDIGLTPDFLLTTAASANFFDYSNEQVSPRVRLLGRLASVAPMRIGSI